MDHAYVGQLYLEYRRALDLVEQLRHKLSQTEQERDRALQLLTAPPEATHD